MNKKNIILIIILFIIIIPIIVFATNRFVRYRNEDLNKKREYEDNIAEFSQSYDMDNEEIARYNELQDNSQRTLNLLCEYFGKEEIEELYKNVEENSFKDGEYVISEYAEELLDKILQLVEKEQISDEDRNMLIDMLSQVNYQELNNKDIKDRLKKIDIEVDK